jgi:hypothetical protein
VLAKLSTTTEPPALKLNNWHGSIRVAAGKNKGSSNQAGTVVLAVLRVLE